MRNFVITIPIDENLRSCMYEMAYRLYIKSTRVCDALIANDPDDLFAVFDGMGDQDLGIEYDFGLEITAEGAKTKSLVITIPLGEKAQDSIYYLGANMRFSAEDIVTSCLLGELPDQLMDIEEGSFSIELCDLPKPEVRGKVSFEIPSFEVMG